MQFDLAVVGLLAKCVIRGYCAKTSQCNQNNTGNEANADIAGESPNLYGRILRYLSFIR